MADLSKITLPSGTTYDIKDAVARSAIAGKFKTIISKDAATTPKGVVWTKDGQTITGTLEASENTSGKFYFVLSPKSKEGDKDVYDEYITVVSDDATPVYSWEKIGNTQIDVDDLGDLAYKDSATGSFTPAGTVAQPTFTGTQGSVSVSGTPSGTISTGTGTANYTPAGSVSTPTITVTPSTVSKYVAASATGGGEVTAGSAASCTLPTLTTTVSNETLTIGWSAGSFTTNTPTSVTLPTFSSQTIATGISGASSTQPTFTGTGAQLVFAGEALTSSGSFTPAGTVSKPGFTGTAGTVTVQ